MSGSDKGVTRRAFLTGAVAEERPGADEGCISSAVISVLPTREHDVIGRLAAMPGVEVGARQNGKIVLVLEGSDSGAVGALLASISVMDGVVSANMVFEHAG